MKDKGFTAKIRIRRIPYYIHSSLELFTSIKPKFRFKFIKDLLSVSHTKKVYLKNNLIFKLISLLDILTLKEVVIDNEYQSFGVQVDKKDKIIVDIGAGFGDFSVMIAKKFPQAKVYAFEPDNIYFKLLKENLGFNGVQNVFPFNKPIFDLKTIFQTIKSKSIDFLKIDCEGCEFTILTRSQQIPYLEKIYKIVIEYHEDENHKISEIIKVLSSKGFKVKKFPRKSINYLGLLAASRV